MFLEWTTQRQVSTYEIMFHCGRELNKERKEIDRESRHVSRTEREIGGETKRQVELLSTKRLDEFVSIQS